MRASTVTTTRFVLTSTIAGLMVLQSSLGLLLPGQYRDVEWIRAAWFGNDWVTLVVAVPLLVLCMTAASRGSVRGVLGWCGMLAYTVYNYAYYLLGAALNAFFLIYVVLFVLAVMTIILALSSLDLVHIRASFLSATPVRLIGGYLTFVGFGLGVAWIGMWSAYVFAGKATPVEPGAFKLVAALDLSMMVPVLTAGGILLWRRYPFGYILAGIAGVQAALYLVVLSINSLVVIRWGLAKAPGELPVWGTLAVFTVAITLLLFRNVRSEHFERISASIGNISQS
jgi:hypothetical protein